MFSVLVLFSRESSKEKAYSTRFRSACMQTAHTVCEKRSDQDLTSLRYLSHEELVVVLLQAENWCVARKILQLRWLPLSSLFRAVDIRSEEHTSELQSLMRISYAVFCLKKKKYKTTQVL